MERTREISRRLKVRLWLAACAIALIGTTIPLCTANARRLLYFVLYAWNFPMGAIAFLFPNDMHPSTEAYTLSLVGGWLFYIGLTVVGLRQRRPLGYFIIYGILCSVLILNAVGCNVNMLKGS